MVALAPLHSDHMEKLRTAFLAINTGVCGQITREEFSAFVEAVHRRSAGVETCGPQTAEEVEALFEAANGSQSGRISYTEWFACHDNVMRAFHALDQSRRGAVTAAELCEVLPFFSVDELSQEMRSCCPVGGTQLSFDDFCHLAETSHHNPGRR